MSSPPRAGVVAPWIRRGGVPASMAEVALRMQQLALSGAVRPLCAATLPDDVRDAFVAATSEERIQLRQAAHAAVLCESGLENPAAADAAAHETGLAKDQLP